MATYNITSQADLENLPTLTSRDTVRLMNDIALTNWSPIGRTFAGVFDGNGHKITGLTNRTNNFATASQAASGYSIGSTITLLSGGVHTIAWVQGPISGTGVHKVVGTGNDNDGCIKWQGNTTITYAVGTGSAWSPATWTVSAVTTPKVFTIVRYSSNVTLYINGVSQGTKSVISNVSYAMKASGFMLHASGTWSSSINYFLVTSDTKDAGWIARHYNGGFCFYATTSNTPNLTNFWPFQEGTGTTAADVIGGRNLTGVDGWTSVAQNCSFMNNVSGTVKNLTFDSPSITNGTTSTTGMFSTTSGGTIQNCEVLNGLLETTYNNSGATIGGLVGFAGSTSTIKNCRVLNTDIKTVTPCRSGGVIGNINQNGLFENLYSTGGTTYKPVAGIAGFLGDYGTIRNCFSTMDVSSKELFGTKIGSGTFTNNWFYDRSKGESYGTAFSALSDAYDITHAPMSSWDFAPTGYWSKSQDTVTYPPFQTPFSGSIAGTVSGWTSGKTLKLVNKTLSKSAEYTVARGALSSALNCGSTFTVAFTGTDLVGTSVWGILYKDVQNFVCIDGSTNASLRMRLASTDINTNYGQGVTVIGRHRYVFVKTAGAGTKFYYDGRLLVPNPLSNPINSNALNGITYVGSSYSPTTITGTISEVIITNDAKDATWVADDWANGEVKKYDNTETGIVEGFHMDEGTGAVCSSFVTARTVTISPTPTWANYGYTIKNIYTATTTGSGDFAFTSVTGECGSPILIYIEDASVEGSIPATFPDGLMGNVTGISFEQDSVQIGDVKLNDAMTPTLLNSASIYGLTDNNYRVASNVLYYNNGCDLIVPTGCTYSDLVSHDTGETGGIIINGTSNFTNTVTGGINDLTINGTCTLASGRINGDIDCTGSFTANTVQLQVYSPTITNSGTMILRAVFKDDTEFFGDIDLRSPNFSVAGKTYTFEHGKTYAYENLLINGAVGNEITVKSDLAGSRFAFDGAGATLNFADIQDCEADTSDINCIRCINSGGNDNRESSPHLIFWEYQQAFITELATV